MTDHSSITSVTEEDDSDESDTTETSYSRTSDGMSSIMYSSECNTDDKLTPSLVKISISKKENASSNNQRQWKSRESQDKSDHNEVVSDPHPFPYGCDPLPLKFADKQKTTQARKKQRKHTHSFSPLTKHVLHKNLSHQKQCYLPKQEEENFGVDDPDNYLYTDFSDTSSIPCNNNEDDEFEEDEPSGKDAGDHRPFLPDMRSDLWFHAKCFDRYWSHYDFVMEWYRQHVQAVHVLTTQFSSNILHPSMWPQTQQASQPLPRKRNKSKRAKKRARNRRLAKAKQKILQEEMLEDEMEKASIEEDSDSQESGFEMEITDEMMDFFATSFKHRMERDKKEGNSDVIDQQIDGKGGHRVSNLLGPSEQPGVRRSAEMKKLYGHGAPMIHGMETAMQMTFDNIVDRRQPKMWPNMPLKIVFA